MQMDDESLVVSADDRIPVRVSRQEITRIEVSTGRKRQWLKGLMIGAVIGAVTGAYAELQPRGSSFGFGYESRGEAVAGDALLLGLLGAGIPGLFKADRWSAVPLDRVRLSLARTQGRGVRLSVSMGF